MRNTKKYINKKLNKKKKPRKKQGNIGTKK